MKSEPIKTLPDKKKKKSLTKTAHPIRMFCIETTQYNFTKPK